MWMLYVIIYIIAVVIFNQCYKIILKTSEGKGSITVILQFFSGIIALLLCPFFVTKFPSEPYVYILLGISLIFYAISDRLNTTSRKGLEASTYSIIKQLSTVFMVVIGLLFLKETFVLKKFIGTILIILSNVLVFYNPKGITFNKYVVLAIISSLVSTSALFIGVNFSDEFNIAFYGALTVLVPSVLIFTFERVKLSDIKKELRQGSKRVIAITCVSWAVAIVSQFRAYQLGEVTKVAPLSALVVILNVIVGYIFLKERKNLVKKIIAAGLIIVSVILIKG